VCLILADDQFDGYRNASIQHWQQRLLPAAWPVQPLRDSVLRWAFWVVERSIAGRDICFQWVVGSELGGDFAD